MREEERERDKCQKQKCHASVLINHQIKILVYAGMPHYFTIVFYYSVIYFSSGIMRCDGSE